MLLGLLGVAIPVVIHLLNRRRAVGRSTGARCSSSRSADAPVARLQLTDLLLMAGRMLLLGLVALALARPFWTPTPAGADAGGPATGAGGRGRPSRRGAHPRRLRQHGPRRSAARPPTSRRSPGPRRSSAGSRRASTVGVLLARDRVAAARRSADARPRRGSTRPSTDPAARAARATCRRRSPRRCGCSKGPRTTASDIVVLTDGQALPWRPGETARWGLLRDLHAEIARRDGRRRRGSGRSRFGAEGPPSGADGSVGPLELPRGLVPPLLPLTVRTTIANAGPGALTRTAELLVDGGRCRACRRPSGRSRRGPDPAGVPRHDRRARCRTR